MRINLLYLGIRLLFFIVFADGELIMQPIWYIIWIAN